MKKICAGEDCAEVALVFSSTIPGNIQSCMVLLFRFRSAREAVESEKKAIDRGEVLPSEERFDSNCITPGTEFMVRLDAQLQYFVTCKISQDKMWQNCKVIYSGHQVWISKNLSVLCKFCFHIYHAISER